MKQVYSTLSVSDAIYWREKARRARSNDTRRMYRRYMRASARAARGFPFNLNA